ncbi:hypothetical protein D3C86_1432420 [compost metagenome]
MADHLIEHLPIDLCNCRIELFVEILDDMRDERWTIVEQRCIDLRLGQVHHRSNASSLH